MALEAVRPPPTAVAGSKRFDPVVTYVIQLLHRYKIIRRFTDTYVKRRGPPRAVERLYPKPRRPSQP
ncbi:hypothetical protein PUN28_013617 [Cardiocondyla obscurior]|uniref:Uncharacterized protein n=1 Tax=Cardiocondyla obscurior TaxID=286306 RepID=A0AAW2F5G1_9HYME